MKLTFSFLVGLLLMCISLESGAQSIRLGFVKPGFSDPNKTAFVVNSKTETEPRLKYNAGESYGGQFKGTDNLQLLKDPNFTVGTSMGVRSDNIDEKMCLLIKKDIYVDTDFRMLKSAEHLDLDMVFPRRTKPQ